MHKLSVCQIVGKVGLQLRLFQETFVESFAGIVKHIIEADCFVVDEGKCGRTESVRIIKFDIVLLGLDCLEIDFLFF